MNESQPRSIGRTVLAALVLVLAGWILLKFIFHFVAFLFFIVLVGLAVTAVVWALRVLL
jgi:ABC-type glycerol-3-phosphate transport system permease component